jgi:hypothetical protein
VLTTPAAPFRVVNICRFEKTRSCGNRQWHAVHADYSSQMVLL